jgi:hypothetical protein
VINSGRWISKFWRHLMLSSSGLDPEPWLLWFFQNLAFSCQTTSLNSNLENHSREFIVKLYFFMLTQPLVDQSLLIVQASRSHSDTPHSVMLLWTSTELYLIIHCTCNRQTSITPAEFEPTIPTTSGRRPTL